MRSVIPGQDSQDQVEHEEGADDDERHKVDPVEVAAHGVVGLGESKSIILNVAA